MSPATRVENWDVAVYALASEAAGSPLVWGQTDCGSLVRRAASVMYGRDVFGAIPPWASLHEAVDALAAAADLQALFVSLGAGRRPLAFAQTGDIVLVPGADDDGLPRLGVMVGAKALVSDMECGVRLLPKAALDEGATLWRLPHG